ncbi:ABC-type dipeptide/oligopeptide/nickel transport system permease subunit [Kribbella aluminosa]|uniref:ABC-type dipeptide/oligopeptide/nickel transport system permease subunit n=1 Tax=Kribbella aluminosa TaxID=416017 RepID=A0ABS4UJY6_9ACTN|nr:ABC transporter permease [Kribbella aluminosa]MBP2351978.1 ABC-type dipeptide/oligopeptide/nickel transport system permease subunit [Kribbella aluminosa]
MPAATEVVVAVPRVRRRLLRKPRIAIPLGVVVLILIVAAVPGLFAPTDPRACDLGNSGKGPLAGHPFGFDIQGCDLYSNVVYGTRSSVTIGLTVTTGCVLIALVLGCLAAYYRGAVDAVISRTMDIFFGFPALVGQVVILNTLHQRNVVVVSSVLILFAWPAMTRLMRSAALATVDLDFVKAARGLGAGPVRVIARHVLPNSFAPILAVASLGVGGMITAESALTFLGVGLRAPSISWGVQLNQAQDSFRDHPHLLLFPSLFLSVTVLAFVMLGDALRDAFDPRSR